MPDYSVPPEDYEFLWPKTPEQEAQRRAEATAQLKAQERCATLGCSGTRSKRFLQPICDQCALRVWSVIQIEQQEILDRNDADMTEQRRAVTREERLNAPGDIYYIRIGDHIKVGYAKNLSSRLAAYPPTASLLATHPGTRKDEQALHSLFTVHRVAGREWYDPTPELLAHIDRVIAEHGAPRYDPFTRRLVQPPKPPPVQMRRRSAPAGFRVA